MNTKDPMSNQNENKFRNTAHQAVLNVLSTSFWLSTKYENLFKPYNISRAQYNVLRVLYDKHPTTLNLFMIQKKMIAKMSNSTRLVEKLRQRGYVNRILSEENRRKVEISITEAGLILTQELNEKVNILEDSSIEHLTENEKKELIRLMQKLRNK